MALLAMEQFGRMLIGLQPGLRPAASRTEFARTRRAGAAAVWMPTRMVLDEPRIPASWDITSDSLAAWLAGRLAADRLLLVKSVALAGDDIAAATLARRGIVDPAFPAYAARSAREVRCIDDTAPADMERAFRTGHGPGIRIATDAETGSGKSREPPSIAGRRRHVNIAG